MADLWGALAQAAPAATTLTDAYAVPSARHATLEVVICNRGADATIRLAHAIGGAADDPAQYLLWDLFVAAGETKSTARFTAAATDVIRVYGSTGDLTFNVNGIEEDG